MTPGPKLVHAIQHQIFKEKKKKFARPHKFPTMVARESRIFLVSPYDGRNLSATGRSLGDMFGIPIRMAVLAEIRAKKK